MGFFDLFKKKQDNAAAEPSQQPAVQAAGQQRGREELAEGLQKTKSGLFSKLARAVAGRSTVDVEVLDDLEEVLITSDVGVETTVKIIRSIEERIARDKYMNTSELNAILRDEIASLLEQSHTSTEDFGIEVKERRSLYDFIGPPLRDSFRLHYGFSEGEIDDAVRFYREYYFEKGWAENIPYPGIQALLRAQKSLGKRLILATSKPDVLARRILAHFGLDSFFDFIAGSSLDGERSTKADVIQYALRNMPGASQERILMVGDRKYDVIGARANGIASLGVLYGYGSRDELSAAGADFIAASVADLQHFLSE